MFATHRIKQAGFTLIEMVLTIVVMSIISIVIGKLLLASYKTATTDVAINTISSEALMGVERMVYDLRNASSITAIASNSLTFVDQTGTSYTYALSSGLVTRGSYTLLDSAQSITFTYLDQTGAVTAVPANVQYVQISVSMLSNTIPLTYTTLVSFREAD